MKHLYKVFLIFILILLVSCGGQSEDNSSDNQFIQGITGSTIKPEELVTMFDEFETGDDFKWGEFIRGEYLTTEIRSLPIPVYLAFFSPYEESIIKNGVEIANQAIGFDLFEIVDEWTLDCRIIYKVHKIEFEEQEITQIPGQVVVGYTYVRSIHLNGHEYDDVVATDWAIEIRADRINKWVVAHELGHAAGILEHAFFTDEDELRRLQANDLMSSKISAIPTTEDYETMMRWQGEVLMEYLESIGANF